MRERERERESEREREREMERVFVWGYLAPVLLLSCVCSCRVNWRRCGRKEEREPPTPQCVPYRTHFSKKVIPQRVRTEQCVCVQPVCVTPWITILFMCVPPPHDYTNSFVFFTAIIPYMVSAPPPREFHAPRECPQDHGHHPVLRVRAAVPEDGRPRPHRIGRHRQGGTETEWEERDGERTWERD